MPVSSLTCPHCGSDRLRRSAPRGLGERFLRALSPAHFYRCRACGRRGWHLGRVGRAHRQRRTDAVPGRPMEKRDVEARRRKATRAAVAVAAAVGLGLVTGLVVQTCAGRAPSVLPGR